MTEKLLTGTLSLNTTNQLKLLSYYQSSEVYKDPLYVNADRRVKFRHFCYLIRNAVSQASDTKIYI